MLDVRREKSGKMAQKVKLYNLLSPAGGKMDGEVQTIQR